MADYNHNLPPAAYEAALRYELLTATTREHKAAIVEELERIGGRTNVENRADVESAQAATGPQSPAAVDPAGPGAPRHAHDSLPGAH